MENLRFTKTMLLMVIMIAMMGNMVKSELHYVGGGKFTWVPDVNLTQWSLHEHFHLNDWLYFGYDRHMFNVLEVNKTSYENCIDTGFIKNVSKGAGRDVFQLTEVKTYYFLSGGGFCWNGMKVAIDVTENVAPTSPPPKRGAPLAGGSSALDASPILIIHTFFVLVLVFMWTIFLE